MAAERLFSDLSLDSLAAGRRFCQAREDIFLLITAMRFVRMSSAIRRMANSTHEGVSKTVPIFTELRACREPNTSNAGKERTRTMSRG